MKEDLIRVLTDVLGKVQVSEERKRESAKKQLELQQMAFADHNFFKELCRLVADEINQVANRKGLARRCLARQDLSPSQVPTIRLRALSDAKSVVVATGNTGTRTYTSIENLLYPVEYYNNLSVELEKPESNQNGLMEWFETLCEASFVREDRVFINLLECTSGSSRGWSGSPSSMLESLAEESKHMSNPTLIIGQSVWGDVVSSTELLERIIPCSKHELLLTGQLGSYRTSQGREIPLVSDAFRHPAHRALHAESIYVVGECTSLGQYTDRGGYEVMPMCEGSKLSGFLNCAISMAVVEQQSVLWSRNT